MVDCSDTDDDEVVCSSEVELDLVWELALEVVETVGLVVASEVVVKTVGEPEVDMYIVVKVWRMELETVNGSFVVCSLEVVVDSVWWLVLEVVEADSFLVVPSETDVDIVIGLAPETVVVVPSSAAVGLVWGNVLETAE